MSAAVQRRRGTAAQMAAFTGLQGEIAVDTDVSVAVVHDGVTPGGHYMARADQVLSIAAAGAVGDLFTSTGGTGTARLADVVAGSVLVSGGVNAAPAWSSALPVGMTIATPAVGDTSTKIANMAAVAAAVAALVASAPTLLNTLKELADAIGDDPNFAVTITNYVATKAAKGANADITSLSALSTALSIAQGGTGQTNAIAARSALSAATRGANSDITSLTGLTTSLSLGQGGTGAVDAKSARAALGLDQTTSIGNAAYAILPTDRTILLTALLTAPRTWTLPAASAMNAGAAMRITDQAGGISAANTLTIATSGSDKINGAASVPFSAPFTDFQVVTDGIGAWTFDVQGLARGGTGATSAAAARTNLGAAASGVNADITSLGAVAGVTAASGSNNTLLATTGFITAALTGYVPVSSLGVASGIATLDGTGKLTPAQTPAALVGAVVYQGTWNASTNSPALTSSQGTKGFYYKVSTAGTTALNGTSQWNVGDTVIYDGAAWDKIDGIANEVISVAGKTGAVSLVVGDVSGAATSGANSNITSLSGLTTALSVGQGGTGATTASAGRAALGAAASGANNDIASLGALTTALSVAQGGTGAISAAAARAALGAAASGSNADITALTALTAATSFTPTVTFATPADLAVSYATQVGVSYQVGKLVFVFVNLVFTPTYAMASGFFRVALPVAAHATAESVLQILNFSGSTAVAWPGTATMIVGEVVNGTSYAQIAGEKTAVATSRAGTSNVVSGNAITLTLSGVYLAA